MSLDGLKIHCVREPFIPRIVQAKIRLSSSDNGRLHITIASACKVPAQFTVHGNCRLKVIAGLNNGTIKDAAAMLVVQTREANEGMLCYRDPTWPAP